MGPLTRARKKGISSVEYGLRRARHIVSFELARSTVRGDSAQQEYQVRLCATEREANQVTMWEC